jgi:8-oxo-dGTP pyrophosphatase MutT (NUDIX family)
MSNWQRLGTKIVYQNQWMTVHEDNAVTPNGKPTVYGWVETPPAVFIVALGDDGKVLLIKQLRYTTGQPSWELPAGNATEGEDQLTAAKRELEEEAGLHADNWASLGGEYYVWNGAATQRNTVHIARGLHKAKNPHQDTTEAISAVQSFTWA